jgi:hypothetical protein
MVKREEKLSEAKKYEKLRELAFKICSALNPEFDFYDSIKLVKAFNLVKNEDFLRIYSFYRSRYSKEGFFVVYYNNNLSFRSINDIMPFKKKSRIGNPTYFYVILHILTYVLKRHRKINLEVRGKESFELTISSKDLEPIPRLENVLETKII